MRKMIWMVCVSIALLLMIENKTAANSQYGKNSDGTFNQGCVIDSSAQIDISDLKLKTMAIFEGRADSGWQIENPEATLAGMTVGNFKFKNEQQTFSFFSKELVDDGFVLKWRTGSEEISLYMPWSRISPLPKGEGILCRRLMEK